MTVAEWLDIWSAQYLGSVKSSTVAAYKATIRTHIKGYFEPIRGKERGKLHSPNSKPNISSQKPAEDKKNPG